MCIFLRSTQWNTLLLCEFSETWSSYRNSARSYPTATTEKVAVACSRYKARYCSSSGEFGSGNLRIYDINLFSSYHNYNLHFHPNCWIQSMVPQFRSAFIGIWPASLDFVAERRKNASFCWEDVNSSRQVMTAANSESIIIRFFKHFFVSIHSLNQRKRLTPSLLLYSGNRSKLLDASDSSSDYRALLRYIHALALHLGPKLSSMTTQWNKGSLAFQRPRECSDKLYAWELFVMNSSKRDDTIVLTCN